MGFQGTGKVRLTERAGAPATPPANNADIYLSSGSPGVLKAKKDDGSVVDLEQATGSFIPVSSFDVYPTGADMTSALQTALTTTAPSGATLAFDVGTYIINGVEITRPMSFYLPAGCLIKTNASAGRAVFWVKGAVTTASSKTLIQSTGDVHWPRGGDREIYLTAGDQAAFANDTWVMVEDTEPLSGGYPSDPNMEFARHAEVVKVWSNATSGVLKFYTPLMNSYQPYSAVDPKVRAVTPVEGVHFFGKGTIQNETAPTGSNTAHGIFVFYAMDVSIEGIRINRCVDSCVHVVRSEVEIDGVRCANGINFDSRGYGVTAYSQRVQIAKSKFNRLRHGVDFSFFSRSCSVEGSSFAGSTTGHINTHEAAVGHVIEGNVLDGGYGQDVVGPSPHSVDYGDSVVQASGINVDVAAKDITIKNNVIRNMRLSGIYVDTGGFSELLTNGALTSGTSWSVTGDFALTSNAATFTFSTGTGTLTQTSGNFAIAAEIGFDYVVNYTVTANTLTGGTLTITSAFGGTAVTLPAAAGAHSVQLRSGTSTGNFVIQLSGVSAGALTIDDISVRREYRTEFVTIEGNAIENCCLYRRVSPGGITNHAGIAVQENSAGGTDRKGIVIKGNTLREPGPYGILAGIDNMLVEGNWVYKAEDKMVSTSSPTTGVGIWISPSASGTPAGVVVRGNHVWGCLQDGIRVGKDAAANVVAPVVDANECWNNGSDGIFVEDTATEAMVRGNDCRSNGRDGINTQADAGVYRNNKLVANANYGLRLITGADNNLIDRNTYASNTSGAVSDAGTGNLHVTLDPSGGQIHNSESTSSAPFEVRAPFIFNELGADIDARFEGDSDPSALVVDASAVTGGGNAGAVGVGIATPQRKFHTFWQDSTNTTVVAVSRFQRNTTSGSNGAAGIGVALELATEDDGGNTEIVGEIDAIMDVATNGAEDSSIRLKVKDAGTQKEVMRIDGAVPGVMISNNATATPAERLDVDTEIRSRSLRLDGDVGSGVSGTVTLCNVTDVSANSTGVMTIKLKGTTSRDSTGFLKFYDGTTTYYIPFISTITG